MTTPPATAAIRFEPDGFDLSGDRLMGRQAAGNGFLRAAVAARGADPVVGYGPTAESGHAFARLVRGIDPLATSRWIRADQLDAFSGLGVCFRPDPSLGQEARLRLRVGPARHCLTGVTHTTASAGTMGELVGLLREPLMPWDAVICTSEAVAETLRRVHEAEADYLRWRFGAQTTITGPQLPVIPLGVHCEDFAGSTAERTAARAALGLVDDEVTALFVGRLAFAGKAHPAPMFQGLQAAAERTGRRVALVLCGWWPNKKIEDAFKSGAAMLCPDVRLIFVDGREPAERRNAWVAGDLFVSLSDNIQETFGLTPVEAMAAGLPVIVTDWNGYRDTVREGVDGFRIKTWAPAAGNLEPFARAHEADVIDYDRYCWSAVAATSVDLRSLTDRLAALIDNPELRRTMGEAGRERARSRFDWSHVFGEYQALWASLNERRKAVAANPDELAWLSGAPRGASRSLEPFEAFGHYPTASILPSTRIELTHGASLDAYSALAGHVLFVHSYSGERQVSAIWNLLSAGSATVEDLARAGGISVQVVTLTAGTLAKMGLVILWAE